MVVSQGDKAILPSAVKALHWLPALPAASLIYSMDASASHNLVNGHNKLKSTDIRRGNSHTHTHTHTQPHPLH